ncbi:hypothetical protein FPZ54_00780 [Sphingomonas suaedae]|uniref:Uncharacterized protein n=1 Tax=Sphingomonas suaedae TaxID=2599297 RepID=A0A518RB51_9SPHN|nr:hypothetical protein [Sphingomonas suaedae]QDX24705.1 hypothetical protein FPZ54_00780 [Sphingomonas suaedae]
MAFPEQAYSDMQDAADAYRRRLAAANERLARVPDAPEALRDDLEKEILDEMYSARTQFEKVVKEVGSRYFKTSH